jgi:UDP-N-acetylmuramoylalanine--D-glutamate ligase
VGAYVKEGHIVIRDEQKKVYDICAIDDIRIPGSHNLENALAASAIAFFAGIGPEAIGKAITGFEGVAHRLEFVREVRGIRFVNDSKGTNPDASIKAVKAMPDGVVLIAGGYDKGSEFDELIENFGGAVKHLVLLGKTAQKIKETAQQHGFTQIAMASDMRDSVNKAYGLAQPGDTVLLSPACASWDMYSCFEERGEDFKTVVKGLA